MGIAPTEFVHEGAYVDYGRSPITRNQWLWANQTAKIWLSCMAILLTVALARLFKAILRIDKLAAEHAELDESWDRGDTISQASVSDLRAMSAGAEASVPEEPSNPQNNAPIQPSSSDPSPVHIEAEQLESDESSDRGTRSRKQASISDISPIPRVSKKINSVLSPMAVGGQILFAFPEEARDEKSLEGKGWHAFLEFLRKLRPGAIQLGTDPSANEVRLPLDKDRWKKLSLLFVGAVSYFGFYVGVLLCGIFTARLATDSIAPSASPTCGVFVPPMDDPAITYNVSSPYEFKTQVDSAVWAQRCYHAEHGADGCNLFLQQSIRYDTKHNASCPFAEYMCYGGRSSSISFSTGAVSVRALGINMPKTYEFERNTTCSPLNMNGTYIKLHKNGSEYRFTYHYGPSVDIGGDWSWLTRTYGTDVGKSSSYHVGTLMSIGGWEPLPELQPPKGSSTTIIFVLPQKIFYLAPSDDPIFPANKLRYLDDKTKPYWLYTRGHATVLACIDRTRWRDPDQGETWNSMQSIPPDVLDRRVRGGLWLFWFSILNSNTYQALNKRLANALEATERINVFTSMPLAPEQWKTEATRLFETSLARTQVDARNIARGVLADVPGYRRLRTPPAMCEDTYLFVSQGWTNVSMTLSLIILIPCVIFLILAIPIDADRMLPELVSTRWAMFLAAVTVFLVVMVRRGIRYVLDKVFSRKRWVDAWTGAMNMVRGAIDGWKIGWKILEKIGKLWNRITCHSTE